MTSPSGRAKFKVGIGVQLPRHRRWLFFPTRKDRREAMGLWLEANCYTREEELSGWCPIGILLDGPDDPARQVIANLVETGLLAYEDQDGVHGIRVLRYEEYNETKEQIDKRLLADRLRKQRNRNPGGVQSDIDRKSTGNRGGRPGEGKGKGKGKGDLPSEIKEDSDNRARPMNASADGAGGLAVTAWADGIRSVTGTQFVGPRGGTTELAKLVDAIRTFGAESEDVVGWAREAGTRYAKARVGERYNAHGFLDWLNSGSKDRSSVTRVVSQDDGRPYTTMSPPPNKAEELASEARFFHLKSKDAEEKGNVEDAAKFERMSKGAEARLATMRGAR